MSTHATAVLGQRVVGFFDSRFQHVARNSVWTAVTTIVVAGAVFAETILLARYLGTKGFGVYVLVIAYPEAIQIILDFRTREAMTRYLGDFLARNQAWEAVAVVKLLSLINLGVLVSAFLIVVASAPLVAPWLTDDREAASLMQVYAIAMLFGGLDTTAGSVLRVFDRFRLSFLTGAGMIVLRVSIVAGLISAHSSLEGLIWGRVVAEIVTTSVIGGNAFVLLKRALWPHRRAPIRVLSSRRGEITRFLLHLNVQGSIRAAATKLDVLLVGLLGGPASASIYKVGVQFGSSPLLLSDPLFVAVYPLFTRWRALGHTHEIRSVGRKATLVLASVALPVAASLAMESKPIVSTAVGADFSDAWLPMVVILVAVLPVVSLFWGRAAMLSFGDARTATRIILAATALQLALLAVLVPLYGATGGAVAFAAMNLSSALLTLVYLKKRVLV